MKIKNNRMDFKRGWILILYPYQRTKSKLQVENYKQLFLFTKPSFKVDKHFAS